MLLSPRRFNRHIYKRNDYKAKDKVVLRKTLDKMVKLYAVEI